MVLTTAAEIPVRITAETGRRRWLKIAGLINRAGLTLHLFRIIKLIWWAESEEFRTFLEKGLPDEVTFDEGGVLEHCRILELKCSLHLRYLIWRAGFGDGEEFNFTLDSLVLGDNEARYTDNCEAVCIYSVWEPDIFSKVSLIAGPCFQLVELVEHQKIHFSTSILVIAECPDIIESHEILKGSFIIRVDLSCNNELLHLEMFLNLEVIKITLNRSYLQLV